MSVDSFAPAWDRVVLGGLSLRDLGLGNAVAGAVTLNANAGRVTTEILATPPNGDYVLTMTNSQIAADDMVLATVRKDTATNGNLRIDKIEPSAGQVVITVHNSPGAGPVNGTLKIGFLVLKT